MVTSITQYTKNPLIFTYYAYYLLYFEEKTYNKYENELKNIKYYEKEEAEGKTSEDGFTDDNNDDENKEEIKEKLSYEGKINTADPTGLLSQALTCKLNIFKDYYVRYLLYEIREKKKEDKNYYKKEAIEKMMNLQ
ncbi:hypothetical protein BCR36DRAFT_415487, partial [Piromyces finnis]